MSNEPEPVVLELAPLPREQIGPFLLLGLDKDADAEEIDAHWAQRVIWARKNLTRVPLEDINWAREAIRDADRRVRCDVASLNLDTTAGLLRQLVARFCVGPRPRPGWEVLDNEPDFRDHTPAVEVPDPQTIRTAIVVPDIPLEVPAAIRLLQEQVTPTQRASEGTAPAPLDPWELELPEPHPVAKG
jgi:hypothetical protein